eukprot:53977_1
MNGLIIFNNNDGKLLLHKQYIARFGFKHDVKESQDVLYLSTMLFSLYCNAHFIQKEPISERDSITSITIHKELLILFHSHTDHPYILCTINSTKVSYKTSCKSIELLSNKFNQCISTLKSEKSDELREAQVVKQFSQSIHVHIRNIFNEIVTNLLNKTFRSIVNCWIIYDEQYFKFIDTKTQHDNIDPEKKIRINKNENNEFDAVFYNYKEPKRQRQMVTETHLYNNSNIAGLIYNILFCCLCKQKLEMDPLLKFEYKPNENFENLKLVMQYLENDHNYKLSVSSEIDGKMNYCKFKSDKEEYWYIRYDEYCLIVYFQLIEDKMYPIDLYEFVDRNCQQIVDLFNFIKLHSV